MNDFKIEVNVVVENTARGRGLLGEHGLAYWLRQGERAILFDTGQGLTLRHNAEILGIDWRAVEAIVLSHGHYDHTGGLRLFDDAFLPSIYAHPDALNPKYGKDKNGTVRKAGMNAVEGLDVKRLTEHAVWTEEPTEVFPKVWVTGAVPRTTDFETIPSPFYQDAVCETPDTLQDDQSMYIETARGIVVLLGCAHAGVINTLRYIQTLVPGQPITHVIGGMHLVDADEARIKQTIAAFQEMGVEWIAPCHCTGFAATAMMCAAYGERCLENAVGSGYGFG